MEWEETPTLLVEMAASSLTVDSQIIRHLQASKQTVDLTSSTSTRIVINCVTLVTKMQLPSATLEMEQEEIHT